MKSNWKINVSIMNYNKCPYYYVNQLCGEEEKIYCNHEKNKNNICSIDLCPIKLEETNEIEFNISCEKFDYIRDCNLKGDERWMCIQVGKVCPHLNLFGKSKNNELKINWFLLRCGKCDKKIGWCNKEPGKQSDYRCFDCGFKEK